MGAGNRNLIWPLLHPLGETRAFALEDEQSHRSHQHSSYAQCLPFFVFFFLFFLTKVTRTTSGGKKPEPEMGQTVVCYRKNIKRKLVHSTNSKLHMCLQWFGCGQQQKRTQPPLPLLGCGGEWKEAGRNWWVGIRAV